MAIKVMIVDDHRIVRQGLHVLLNGDQELEVVGEATNGQEAVELAQQLKPDVVLMDLMMPVMNGIQATTLLRKALPNTEVLVLTSILENKDISVGKAIGAGAIGYLLKDTESQELNQAIKAAAAGHIQLSSQTLARLREEMRESDSTPDSEALSPTDFTRRELEVLTLLAQGYSNKAIASLLQVSETTIKTHVSHLFAKLGVQNRAQATYQAIQRGLVTIPKEVVDHFSYS